MWYNNWGGIIVVEEILEYIDSYVDMETATLCMLYERKIYAMNRIELKIAKEKTEKELSLMIILDFYNILQFLF